MLSVCWNWYSNTVMCSWRVCILNFNFKIPCTLLPERHEDNVMCGFCNNRFVLNSCMSIGCSLKICVMKLPRRSLCVTKHLIVVVKIKFVKPRVLSQFQLTSHTFRELQFSSVFPIYCVPGGNTWVGYCFLHTKLYWFAYYYSNFNVYRVWPTHAGSCIPPSDSSLFCSWAL